VVSFFRPLNIRSRASSTRRRLDVGPIRPTIDRATLGPKVFGHSSSGSALKSLERAGAR
jgi:hypothetical protein